MSFGPLTHDGDAGYNDHIDDKQDVRGVFPVHVTVGYTAPGRLGLWGLIWLSPRDGNICHALQDRGDQARVCRTLVKHGLPVVPD